MLQAALLLCLFVWPPAPVFSRPAAETLPLVYTWGDSYLNVAHALASHKVPVIQEAEGDFLRVRHAGLEVRYRFYTKEKIGDIILGEREEEGRTRAVLERLVLAPAHPKEEAPLYAVDVLLPGLPLDDSSAEAGVDDRDRVSSAGENEREALTETMTPDESRSLLVRLESLYGRSTRRSPRDRLSPAQSEATRRAREKDQGASGRRTAGTLQYGNRDTLVRVEYEVQGARRFARRMSFVSREISRLRNRDIEKLQKKADRQIRKKIRVADRALRREARQKR